MINELINHIQTLNAKSRAWVAEDAANRWSSLLSEDTAHWAEMGIHTVAEFKHYMLVVDVFESTRSVHGYKPSWSHLMAATDEMLEREMAQLEREAKRQCEDEEREEQRRKDDEREHAERTAQALNHASGFSIGLLVKL